jgi:ParB-like chromosome segregation protein Spo0J
MDAKAALKWLQSAESQHVSLTDLKTDEAFQPRAERLVPYKDRGREQHRSDEQTAAMRLTLEAAQSTQLDAVLVADIDGEYFIVDGHHRRKAYALAKRETIPARVRPLSRHTAVMAAKLANGPQRTLAMHQEQYREAAWQWMADATVRGRKRLTDIGESCRTVARQFRITKDTVSRMMRRLPRVDLADFTDAACDPGTGFPCWKYVRESASHWKDMQETMTKEQLTERHAAKAAAKIGGILADLDADARRLALDMLADEARELALDRDDIAQLAYDGSGDF